LLEPSRWDLIQIPDHPVNLAPLGTRQTVMAVVDKNDTSQWLSKRALCLVHRGRRSTSRRRDGYDIFPLSHEFQRDPIYDIIGA
jgi:hypothetical protein